MTNSDDCGVANETIAGWRAVILENDLLRVAVLPEKGADIYGFVHKRSGVDVLLKTPWGLQPPNAPHREGSGDLEFLWNYEGGWQELFPSANDACAYGGRPIPFHGEVATLAWDHQVRRGGPDEVEVLFSVRCRQTPFRLERVMRLKRREACLYLDQTVTNESASGAHLVWGHHCVVGAPFLEAGCRLHTPAWTILTLPDIFEQTARLAPGQREPWPTARLRGGGTVDLHDIPGPEAHSHDDAYLTDLTAGWAAVSNPRLDLTFSLHWDPAVFRWLVCWQPYGGAEAMPLTGLYGLGIEPWTTRLNLEQAVAAGQALELAGGASFSTWLRAEITVGVEGRR